MPGGGIQLDSNPGAPLEDAEEVTEDNPEQPGQNDSSGMLYHFQRQRDAAAGQGVGMQLNDEPEEGANDQKSGVQRVAKKSA